MTRKILLLTKKQDQTLAPYLPKINLSKISLKEVANRNLIERLKFKPHEKMKKDISDYFAIRHDPLLTQTLAYINAIIETDDCLILPYNSEKKISDKSFFSEHKIEEAHKIIAEAVNNKIHLDEVFLSTAPLKFKPDKPSTEDKPEVPGTLKKLNISEEGFYFNSLTEFNEVKNDILKRIFNLSKDETVKKGIKDYWDFDNKKLNTDQLSPLERLTADWEYELILGIKEYDFRTTPLEIIHQGSHVFPASYSDLFEHGYSMYRDDFIINNHIENNNSTALLDLLKSRIDLLDILTEENFQTLYNIAKLLNENLAELVYSLPEKEREVLINNRIGDEPGKIDGISFAIAYQLVTRIHPLRVEFRNKQKKLNPYQKLAQNIIKTKENLLEKLLRGFNAEDRKSIFRNFAYTDHDTVRDYYYELDVLLSPKHLYEYLSYLTSVEKFNYFFKTASKLGHENSEYLPESIVVSVNALFTMEEDQVSYILDRMDESLKSFYLEYPLQTLIDKGLIPVEKEKVLEQIKIRHKHLPSLDLGGICSELTRFFSEDDITDIKNEFDKYLESASKLLLTEEQSASTFEVLAEQDTSTAQSSNQEYALENQTADFTRFKEVTNTHNIQPISHTQKNTQVVENIAGASSQSPHNMERHSMAASTSKDSIKTEKVLNTKGGQKR